MDIKNEMIKSLRLQYESEIQKAKTTIRIYLNNSVGIGEHPQHLEEIDKQIEIISTNEDKLEALNKHFNMETYININSNDNLNLSNCSVNSNCNNNGW